MKVREASLLMGANAEDVSAELFDKEITDFSIDSRSVKAGELFFALSQEDYARAGFNGIFADGHQYIEAALGRGAIAAVARADRVRGDQGLTALNDRLLLVDDAIAALQTLAHRVYESWGKPVVGHYRQRRENYREGIDRASSERDRPARVEERAKLQQRSRPAAVGFANGERGQIARAV